MSDRYKPHEYDAAKCWCEPGLFCAVCQTEGCEQHPEAKIIARHSVAPGKFYIIARPAQ